jgi:predicted nucleotidyltransferase
MSLFDVARLERKIQEVLGTPVDVVPASSLRANVKTHVLGEAVPL